MIWFISLLISSSWLSRDKPSGKSANKGESVHDVDDAGHRENRRRRRRRTKAKPSRAHLDDLYGDVDDYGDDYGDVYDVENAPDDVDDYDGSVESDRRDYDDYLKSNENEGSGISSSTWVDSNLNLIRIH